jgi:hypothetical protein
MIFSSDSLGDIVLSGRFAEGPHLSAKEDINEMRVASLILISVRRMRCPSRTCYVARWPSLPREYKPY